MSIVDKGEYKRLPQLASGEFFMNTPYGFEPLCREAQAALRFVMNNSETPSVGWRCAHDARRRWFSLTSILNQYPDKRDEKPFWSSINFHPFPPLFMGGPSG